MLIVATPLFIFLLKKIYSKLRENPAQQELGRMVLNPDVVVRSRGVMEKCSMCTQKLQAGKFYCSGCLPNSFPR